MFLLFPTDLGGLEQHLIYSRSSKRIHWMDGRMEEVEEMDEWVVTWWMSSLQRQEEEPAGDRRKDEGGREWLRETH